MCANADRVRLTSYVGGRPGVRVIIADVDVVIAVGEILPNSATDGDVAGARCITSALVPIAVLLFPVLSLNNAPAPTAVLKLPVLFRASDAEPVAVL